MRLTKEVQIDGRRITVKELTVKLIKGLLADISQASHEITGDGLLQLYWNECVDGLTKEAADDMTPSELKIVYDAFEEVNKVFFDLALRVIGENPFLQKVRAYLVADLLVRYVDLVNEVIEESGLMATDSSLPQ